MPAILICFAVSTATAWGLRAKSCIYVRQDDGHHQIRQIRESAQHLRSLLVGEPHCPSTRGPQRFRRLALRRGVPEVALQLHVAVFVELLKLRDTVRPLVDDNGFWLQLVRKLIRCEQSAIVWKLLELAVGERHDHEMLRDCLVGHRCRFEAEFRQRTVGGDEL